MALAACSMALLLPAGAGARPAEDPPGSGTAVPSQDLRSPDARDAAAQPRPAPAEVTVTTTRSTGDNDDTLAIVLASSALGIALAGGALSLVAMYRRPRPRWTAS